jgi:hypothetical protein
MYDKMVDLKKRQAGKRYESNVAWSLRSEGWNVTETGLEGVNDHGIDLIATRDGITRYVQCKGWSSWKTIHEDVISQLVGSVANAVGLDNMHNNVELYLYSPAVLAPYAQAEAAKLNVHFVRMPNLSWRRQR